MRRIVISLLVLIAVVGGIWLFIRSRTPSLTPEQVQDAFDDSVQSMSIKKDFQYTILSLRKASAPSMSGEIWCIHFDPPMFIGEPQETGISHFVVIFEDPMWSGLRFEDHDKDKWEKMGCDDKDW